MQKRVGFEKERSVEEYVTKLANGEFLQVLETKMPSKKKQSLERFTNRIRVMNTGLNSFLLLGKNFP